MKSSLLVGVFFFSAVAYPVLWDGTAATVGSTLITVQDARFFRSIQRIREGANDPIVIEEGEVLRKTIQKMMFEEMVFAEAASFQFKGASRAEADKLLSKGSAAVWSRLSRLYGRSRSQAAERLMKSLQVERFIQKKVETLTPVITDAEVARYISQNKNLFQGNDLEKLKPSVVLLLRKHRVEKGLEEWVRFLKEKYGLTNFLEG